MARSPALPEGITFVTTMLLGGSLGVPQGGTTVGLGMPEAAVAGAPLRIEVTIPPHVTPRGQWHEPATSRSGSIVFDAKHIETSAGPATRWTVEWTLNNPGLYTVTIQGLGSSRIAADVLLTPRT